MKNRVRLIIIRNNKIILIKRTVGKRIYWVIPGGKVEENETFKEALVREAEEELNIKIKVNKLLVKLNCMKSGLEDYKEYFYLCEIVSGEPKKGNGPEYQNDTYYKGRYDIEWREIEKLDKINIQPEIIKNIIIKNKNKIYE